MTKSIIEGYMETIKNETSTNRAGVAEPHQIRLRHGRGNIQKLSASFWFGKMALGKAEQQSTLCVHMCSCLYSLQYNYLAPGWPQ